MSDLFSGIGLPVEGDRLVLSNSGGKTSGYMTEKVLKECRHRWNEIKVIFANTTQENEKTLRFIRNCDEHLDFNSVWVEAVVHPGEDKGCTHRVVTFETARRNGEAFEEMIQKYGIPNQNYPHCTRELKLNPIKSYLASIGWDDYTTAIGIRADEPRRVSASADAKRIVYPLIDWFYTDKDDVNDWWEQQSFNLGLKEHEGNCKWCWKKSFSKHARLLRDSPHIYDFPHRMEVLYGRVGGEQDRGEERPRVFFRGGRSTGALKEYCATIDPWIAHDEEDVGCSGSCEMYQMDVAA